MGSYLQETRNQSMNLHCVGCGNIVFSNYERGTTLAISCACGAYSPILFDPETNKTVSYSYSLMRDIRNKSSVSHFENYLGYHFFHTSDLKSYWLRFVKEIGMTSQQDCDEEKCLRIYERKVTHAITSN